MLRKIASAAAIAALILSLCGCTAKAKANTSYTGTVSAISADSITLETNDGKVTIQLTSNTRFGMGGFGDVSSFSPGAMSRTGIETAALIHSVVENQNPDAVIAIDALAAREADRLARTIQISDAGITPGSGIGNAGTALNEETLGVPVIAIGVPTVVDTATLLRDALEGCSPDEEVLASLSGLFVAPKEIDVIVRNMGKAIGYALNRTLHGDFPYEEMEMIL